MYKILEKKVMSEIVKLMKIKAPLVAKKALAGQFIILRIDEKGERIPLTIADYDRKKGTVTVIFMEVGKTTKHLGTLKVGDSILNFAGPLGQPSEIYLQTGYCRHLWQCGQGYPRRNTAGSAGQR